MRGSYSHAVVEVAQPDPVGEFAIVLQDSLKEPAELSPWTFWISRASSRHSGGKHSERRAALIPDTVLLGRPRDPLVPGSRLQTYGPAGPV